MFSESLLSEYHPTRNQKKLIEYKPQSNKKVWWKCSISPNHEWESVICNRTKGAGCPFCSGRKVTTDTSLLAKYPEIGNEWHPTKNIDKASNVAPGCNKKYWWKCSKNPSHEWEAAPNSRTKGTGCPHCTGKTTFGGNTIKDKYPHLIAEWDFEKNKDLDPSTTCPGTDKKAWWLCTDKKHSYQTKINIRTLRETGCPICKNKTITKENCLESLFPDIAKEWHSTKNEIKPSEVGSNHYKSVHWICAKGHEWKATPTNRTRFGYQCPKCSGRVASPENNLLVKYPDIAKEWHSTKNGDKKPEDFTPSSHTKVWWQCSKYNRHIYQAIIGNRTMKNGLGTGCPYCNQSKMEKATEAILIKQKIRYEPQKKFADMQFQGNQLSYDFYLPEYKAIIELDGRQHFEEASDYFHHNKSYAHQRHRDIVKNAYAAREGFSLLRIAYTEDDYIPQLIETFIARCQRGEKPFNFVGPYGIAQKRCSLLSPKKICLKVDHYVFGTC